MIQRTLLSFSLCFSMGLCMHHGHATIQFGSYNSAITLANEATLEATYSFTIRKGTIKQKHDSSILGNKIYFHKGFFNQTRAQATITGDYLADPTGTGTIELYGTKGYPNVFRADAGTQINVLVVKGDANRLEGFPQFKNPIQLVDANTTATIAIQSVLNQNINLNGGTIILEENLVLADGVSITGHGTISLNDRRLEFGAKDLKMGSSLYWKGAADVYLNGKIELSASWTFEGDCYLNGDSTVLTLTEGADLTIRDNSSLNIRELKIDGLGTEGKNGRFLFADLNTSTLRLRRAALELTTTYTHDRGTIIAEIGSNQIITRDKTFFVEEPGFLLVDGVNLFYKTRTFTNNFNIRPTDIKTEATQLVDSPIETKNQGQILHYKTFSSRQTFQSTSNNGVLSGNLHLGEGKQFTITTNQPILDGDGWYIQFSKRPPLSKQLVVERGVDAELRNVVLKDFQESVIIRSPLGTGVPTIAFGDQTTIEMARGENAFSTALSIGTDDIRIRGFVVIDGKKQRIYMVEKFIIEDGATLVLKNIELYPISPDKFETEGTQAHILLSNAKLILDTDFTFANISLTIADNVEIVTLERDIDFARGELYANDIESRVKFTFAPGASNVLTINSNSKFHFDEYLTFSYDPSTPNNQGIQFTDKSSILSFNGTALSVTSTGLNLTKGTLRVNSRSLLLSEATNIHEAVCLGDGINPANNLNIECEAGGSLDVVTGILEYNNVSN